jgi:hypothetical protein
MLEKRIDDRRDEYFAQVERKDVDSERACQFAHEPESGVLVTVPDV